LVAILGTTISPYLFFWQASQEVEEEKHAGQSTLALVAWVVQDATIGAVLDAQGGPM
jgi:Mn2+/Fe2+ NRAMP family transporter